jgi:hypothetical protein
MALVLQMTRRISTSLPAPTSTPIPYLHEYHQHAAAALRTKSPTHAASHTAALGAVVDQLHQHLHERHIARLNEIRTQPDRQTPIRELIRNQQPAIAQLSRIAETINALTAHTEIE